MIACLLALALQAVDDEGPRLEKLDLRGLPLIEACRLLAEQTGLNLVPSAEAANLKVSLFLRDVPALAAVESLCKSHDLWMHRDTKTGIVRINTVKEYKRDIASFTEEKTEFFTLLYPNALDVAYAVRNLFASRVVLQPGDADGELMMDLAMRFSRFDMIDSRTQGFGSVLGGGLNNTFGGGFGGGGFGRGGFGGGFGSFGGGYESGFGSSGGGMYGGSLFSRSYDPQFQRQTTKPLEATAEEIPTLEKLLAGAKIDDAQKAAILQNLAQRTQSPIYVTVARRQNKLIVRSGDDGALQQIRALVRKLDVPTALLLLEVRVLSVDLLDGFTSFFEYQGAHQKVAGEFTGGTILNPTPPALRPAGTGLREGDLIFQYVDANFAARMQVLAQKNRIRTVATPVLLTANNEVSRLFIGKEVPLNRSFIGGQAIANESTTTTTPGTTGIEFRPVGTTLLFTPTINADRTVTLRIVQESSDVNSTSTVLVPTATGFVPQTVNVVSSQTVSGTIVAKNELAVAFGGLIETGVSKEDEQVPLLGDIPVLGLLFKRKVDRDTRRETVVVVRPFVLSTPAESEAASFRLMEKLGADSRKLDLRPIIDVDKREGAAPPLRLHGIDREEP